MTATGVMTTSGEVLTPTHRRPPPTHGGGLLCVGPNAPVGVTGGAPPLVGCPHWWDADIASDVCDASDSPVGADGVAHLIPLRHPLVSSGFPEYESTPASLDGGALGGGRTLDQEAQLRGGPFGIWFGSTVGHG